MNLNYFIANEPSIFKVTPFFIKDGKVEYGGLLERGELKETPTLFCVRVWTDENTCFEVIKVGPVWCRSARRLLGQDPVELMQFLSVEGEQKAELMSFIRHHRSDRPEVRLLKTIFKDFGLTPELWLRDFRSAQFFAAVTTN